MKKVFVLLMALGGFNSFAEGQGVGNGGDAYLIGTKYYSFDLVEKGMENDVSIDPTLALDPETMAAIKEKISPKQIFPRNEFARKMTELKKILPAYHYILLNVFKHYNWIFVNATLTDVNDVSSVISMDPRKMAQAAIRFGYNISIDKNIFLKMSAINQVALIMHELNYAIQGSDVLVSIHHRSRAVLLKNSDTTRYTVQYLFNPDLTAEGLNSVIRSLLLDRYYNSYPFYRETEVDLSHLDTENPPRLSWDYVVEVYLGGDCAKLISDSISIGIHIKESIFSSLGTECLEKSVRATGGSHLRVEF